MEFQSILSSCTSGNSDKVIKYVISYFNLTGYEQRKLHRKCQNGFRVTIGLASINELLFDANQTLSNDTKEPFIILKINEPEYTQHAMSSSACRYSTYSAYGLHHRTASQPRLIPRIVSFHCGKSFSIYTA